MRKLSEAILVAGVLLLAGCADFPEKYENVIIGDKIRPFSIIMDPPEAAPGDTVQVRLKLYDAEKSYAVAWQLALKYQVNQGATSSGFPSASEIVDLETGALKFDESDDGLTFSIVIPGGDRNPLKLTALSPEVLKSESELSSGEKAGLRKLGISSLQSGLKKMDFINALDSSALIPNELSPLVDGLIGLVQFKAKLSSPGFDLDVTKNLTVRYSNKLDSGLYASNVNRNPLIDSIGFIHVHAAGITHFEEIEGHESDTVFFTTSSGNGPHTVAYDTLKVVPGHSYFLIAATRRAEQQYRSPLGSMHTEQLFFQWFYTNFDLAGADWDDLLKLENGDRPVNLPVVPLKFPKASIGLKHFAIRATVGDTRPEWGILASAGLDYKSVYGFISYE
ncbi:MAG: hypothetical protein M3Y08_15395 [Fibrobacterota bacterium]|nr:hypothetical protein [Fibrobacterota bacterium]